MTKSQKEKRIKIFNLISSQFILTASEALERIIITPNMMSVKKHMSKKLSDCMTVKMS